MQGTKKLDATDDAKRLLLVGPLPPPVHGVAAVNDRLFGALDRVTPRNVFNVAIRGVRPRWLGLAVKGAVYGRVALTILFGSAIRLLYLSLNGGNALVLDLATLALCRLRGVAAILHHHSFAYLDRPSRLMAAIRRISDASVTHVFLSDGMAEAFARRYGAPESSLIVSNAALMSGPAMSSKSGRRARGKQGFSLGFLSNISRDKGFDTVLATFAGLRESNMPVELHVAGPFADRDCEQLLREATAAYGDITYWGAVFDERKAEFFAEIDVLLFPTRYVNEAQPLVVLEGQLNGKPVIAYAKGCIREMLGDDPALAVPPEADFAAAVESCLVAWADPVAFEKACAAALAMSRQQTSSSALGWGRLMDLLHGS